MKKNVVLMPWIEREQSIGNSGISACGSSAINYSFSHAFYFVD